MKQKKNLWILIGIFVIVLVLAGAAYQFLSPELQGKNLMVEGLPEGETVQSSQPEESSSDEKKTPQSETTAEAGNSPETEEAPAESSSSASESETESSYLAPDFTVYDADGGEVTLSSLFGKPTVLNFWASTCPPCRSEMPEFHEVYEEIGNKVQFVMVDCVGVYVGGSMETQEKGQAYIEEQKFTFPVYFDRDMDAVNTYGITSFPTTYFLDKDGNLVTYALGAIDRDTLELGISMITEDTDA